MAADFVSKSDYWDIDDVLAETEDVPVKFRNDAEGLGFLDASSDDKNIKAGTKIELPYWLAFALYGENEGRRFVQYSLPAAFEQRFRSRLLADPKAVDLGSACKYWYEIGTKLVHKNGDSNLASALRAALLARYSELLSFDPKHKATDQYRAFVSKMANAESALWDLKSESESANMKWRSQRTSHLLPSYVTNITPEQSSGAASVEFGAAAAAAAPSASGAGAIARAADAANRKRRADAL